MKFKRSDLKIGFKFAKITFKILSLKKIINIYFKFEFLTNIEIHEYLIFLIK